MKERRSLVDGLTAKPTEEEKAFVYSSSPKAAPAAESVPSTTAPSMTSAQRSPISTRIRTDYAVALKRATLERQLAGIEPNTISDILDEVLGPWLRANGHLS